MGNTDFSLEAGFLRDPKHLGFTLSRYKFAAKMLEGFERVLEVGSGDGLASKIVEQQVGRLTLSDINPRPGVMFHDMERGHFSGVFDGIYALDVMEHIEAEDAFLTNVSSSLKSRGVFVVGMPSLESQKYASPLSRLHHVNCKTQEGLKKSLVGYFGNVFMFGMNDEVLHTGFGPMCHYLFGVCVK